MKKDICARRSTATPCKARSPGVISAFQSNRYYPTHDAYVDAVAAAMKPEYDAIAAAGFVLQRDCPDLAMAGQGPDPWLHRVDV
jgi:5-methyltetrahydropteroyltriglutamate--homocysteine methyltransferase